MQVSWIDHSFEVPREWTLRRKRQLAGAGPLSGIGIRRLAMVVVAAALVAALAPSLPWSASTDAPAERSAEVWPSGLQEAAASALAADAYAVQAVAAGSAGAAWLAPNPAQGLDTRFSVEGLTVAPSTGSEANWSWGLSLAAWGRGDQLVPAQEAQPVAEANRVEYPRGELTEWYVNDAEGLEQGFTVDRAVPGQGSAPLVVQLQTSGGLEAELVDQGQAIAVRSSEGANLLRYDKLIAYDATGAEIPARLGLDGSVLTLTVDDAGAVYPLVIDPLVASQQAKLTADDAAEFDYFGYSVAVSGDTAVVGAPAIQDSGMGSAYVFTRSGSTWTQQDKLTGRGSDGFGYSVAVSGATAVVGAPFDADASLTFRSGSAYVFTRSGTDWTQQAKLTADDAAELDDFGYSVAVSGDTAVVGAPWDDDAGDSSGSAYVFTRSGTDWAQQDKLTADDAAPFDDFGYSVAVSGDTAVVGAPTENLIDPTGSPGSAYVFTRSGTGWTQQAKLTADGAAEDDEFGFSVAISGDTAVMGAPLDDDTGSDSGSAYVFTRTGTDWTLQAKLTADDAAQGDWLGASVAVLGDTAVVGAPDDDDAGPISGSAYVFTRSDSAWTQQAKLTADDATAGDLFGVSVALSGDTALVGAPRDNRPGLESGSAYVFELYPVTASIHDVTVTEGDSGTTEATFTVTRNAGVGAATVEARTLDFSASAPEDYQALSTTVSFAEGETTKTVTVAVNGDTEMEPDEFFLLVLFDPSGVEIAEGEGRASIVNDDDAGEPPTTTTSTTMATTTTVATTTTTAPSGAVVTIDDTVVSNATRGRVTGTVSCEAGRTFALQLSLTQGDATGEGNTRGTCSGSPQAFAIDFVADAGSFSDGSAQACVSGSTAVAGSRIPTSTGEVCEEVTIDVV